MSRRQAGRHGRRHGAAATEAVFVDQSGRRRRLLTIVGAGLAVALLSGLGVLGIGLMTGAKVPLPGWPDSGVQAEPSQPPPAATPESGIISTPGQPVRLSSPSAAPVSPTPDSPGQGDLHRNTARATKSPGKPG